MGCCSTGCLTSPDRLRDMEVSQEINRDRDRAAKAQKLLLLGGSGSGKSTLFKQLCCTYGSGFSEKDRLLFKERISAQIIEQINRSVECIPYYNERLPPDFQPLRLSKKGKESGKYMGSIGPECLVNEEIASHIEILWNEEAIQSIYRSRAIYHIDDSSSYFFNDINRIGNISDYVPSDMDILYVRDRTTGIVESKFSILGSNFHILDIGGLQSESEKWKRILNINFFEDVTAVIFVASLSCYDELMFFEDTINCMHHSLELFKETCSLAYFITTPIILFLNKKDLFEKKIHIIPLSICFAECNINSYNHSSDNNETNNLLLEEQKNRYMIESRNYIKEKFISCNNNAKHRQIYVHIICATDMNNVHIFNDVQQIVVSAGLEKNNRI